MKSASCQTIHVPLATLLLAVFQGQEQFSARAIWGTLLGLVGISLIYLDPGRTPIPMDAFLLMLASVLCFSQALVIVRQLPPIHPITLNVVGITTGALVLLGASILLGESRELPTLPETWVALIYVVTSDLLSYSSCTCS